MTARPSALDRLLGPAVPLTCDRCHRRIRTTDYEVKVVQGDLVLVHVRCPIRLTARGRLVRDVAVAALAAALFVGCVVAVAKGWAGMSS